MNQALPQGVLLHNSNYKVIKYLGQGGYAITYLATNQLGKQLTIKEFFIYKKSSRAKNKNVLFEGIDENRLKKLQNQFKNEGQLLLKVNAAKNNHIVKVQNLFTENNTWYLVLDYVEGISMADLIKNEGPLFFERVEPWVEQISSALSVLHQNKLYHLDVKPDNIIINTTNEAVLIDFGLCSSSHLTNEGEVLAYSKNFASPEQINNNSRPNAQMDIYSFAATIYYAITGNYPPPTNTPDFHENLTGQNQDLQKTLAKALDNNPHKRHPNIYSFRQALPLTGDVDMTVLPDLSTKAPIQNKKNNKKKGSLSKWIPWAMAICIIFLFAYVAKDSFGGENPIGSFEQNKNPLVQPIDSTDITDSSQTKTKNDSTLNDSINSKPTPPPPKPQTFIYTHIWKGDITRKGKNDRHLVELMLNISDQKNANQRKEVTGKCRVADANAANQFAQFNIKGNYDEANSNLHIETNGLIRSKNFNYCAFEGDFFYKPGTTKIKGNFHPLVGNEVSKTACKAFRLSSRIQLTLN